jgi:hypothetical protein
MTVFVAGTDLSYGKVQTPARVEPIDPIDLTPEETSPNYPIMRSDPVFGANVALLLIIGIALLLHTIRKS